MNKDEADPEILDSAAEDFRKSVSGDFELVDDDSPSEGNSGRRSKSATPNDRYFCDGMLGGEKGKWRHASAPLLPCAPFSYCCGCFAMLFFAIAALIGYLLYLGSMQVGATLNMARDSMRSICGQIASGVRGAVKKGVEECRKEPGKTVFVNYDFISAMGADKYCVAEISEDVNRRIERSKWGFSSVLRLSSDVLFQYYVPLRRLRIEISSSSDNPGSIKIRGIFGPLKLETPVVCSVKKQYLNRSYLPSLNDSALNYISSDLPAELEEKGRSPDMMRIAEIEAKKSLESFFRDGLLPILGFSAKEIKEMKIEIAFDSSLASIPDAAPVLPVK